MDEQTVLRAGSSNDHMSTEQVRPDGIIQAEPFIERPGWRLFVAWTVGTILGLIASLLAGAVLATFIANSFLRYSPDGSFDRALSVGGTNAIAGLITGFAQWLVLRRWVLNKLAWIPATGLGWAALGVVSVYLEAKLGGSFYSSPLQTAFWDSLKAAAGGLSVGLCQWVVLRPSIHRAAIWPATTGLSFALGTGIASAIIRRAGVLESGETGIATLVPVLAASAIALVSVGAISGGALVWLLRLGGDSDRAASATTPSRVLVETDANSPIAGSTGEIPPADVTSLSEQPRVAGPSIRRSDSSNRSILVGIAGAGLTVVCILAIVYLLTGPLSRLGSVALLDTGVCGSWDTKLGPPQNSVQGAVPAQAQGQGQARELGGLSAIAAIASNDLWAVGRVGNEPLLQRWDGTAWTRVQGPNPTGSVGTNINSIAAVASDDIWAVGSYFKEPSYANEWTIILHYDGTTWSIVPSPNPGPERNTLVSVAAHGADDVWAVGNYQISDVEWRALVLHWDGMQWNVMTTPFYQTGGDYETFDNSLSDVAVLTPSDVWVVGKYSDKLKSNGYYYGGGLAMHWNGSQWTITPVPRGPDRGDSGLHAVTAISPDDVWAVGIGWYRQARIVRWDGNKWSTVPSPFGEEDDRQLNDVEALAADDIWAVGLTGSLPHRTLVLHWNGTKWGVVESPSPMKNTDFFSIATLGSNAIWALGSSTDNSFESHTAGPPSYPYIAKFSRIGCVTPTATIGP